MSTPLRGPWHVTDRTLIAYTYKGRELPFAGVYEDEEISNGTAEATARLIAAAPELLEALKPFAHYAEIVGPHIDIQCGKGFYESLQNAHAAIAKAEGRT